MFEPAVALHTGKGHPGQRTKEGPLKLARAVAAAGVGYLFGSLSFSRLVGRFVAPGEDLSQSEIPLSGGGTMEYSVVSATTVAMRAGPVPGIITGILDSSKSAM